PIRPPVHAAAFVFVNATKKSSHVVLFPVLNPSHPNQRKNAPITVQGTLSFCSVTSTRPSRRQARLFERGPTQSAATRPSVPPSPWTTHAPAASTKPNLAITPPWNARPAK